MPNTNIAVYLTDDEYVIYADKKKDINSKVRVYLKTLLKDEGGKEEVKKEGEGENNEN